MKKFFIILLFIVISCNFAAAQQVKSKLGFDLSLPKNYFHLDTNRSIDQLISEYKGEAVNMNYLSKLLSSSASNPSYEVFLHRTLNPNGNSINFNVIPNSGSVISDYLKTPKKELCSALRSQIIAIYGGKEKRQLYCDFKSNLSDNVNTSLKIVHDGRLPNQHLIQYQFQIKNNLVTATLGCLKNNCNLMEGDLLKIIRSINY